ncbi:hypothetical protein [Hoeflea olei]|nr:hypothetical protein [Hoeflea olei]
MSTTQTGHDAALSETERDTLRLVAGHMIPASDAYGVPGADDPEIFADILRSLDRDVEKVREALQVLAQEELAALEDDARAARLAAFRAARPELAGVLELAVARCYYRDDRVMTAIGMEPRPPFPLGYEVPQGDLALLDPVRARGPIYRDAG